jgi:hypothetical protein
VRVRRQVVYLQTCSAASRQLLIPQCAHLHQPSFPPHGGAGLLHSQAFYPIIARGETGTHELLHALSVALQCASTRSVRLACASSSGAVTPQRPLPDHLEAKVHGKRPRVVCEGVSSEHMVLLIEGDLGPAPERQGMSLRMSVQDRKLQPPLVPLPTSGGEGPPSRTPFYGSLCIVNLWPSRGPAALWSRVFLVDRIW